MKKINKYNLKLITLIALFISISCSNLQKEEAEIQSKGKLFIIGGGSRPIEMLQAMVQISRTDKEGYIVILPMSSVNQDTAMYYAKKQFIDIGLNNVHGMNFESQEDMTIERLDSVKNANLIYISGGDQSRFMQIVKNTNLFTAIHEAFSNGALIAGTSAGAAVMSKKMITGNEYKYPEYTGEYRTIEAENIEITEGLGLLEGAIIDQHFVKRMRMNRLISACLENPKETCIGIDESTAILVEGNKATVYGLSQVIVLKNKSTDTRVVEGLLGGSSMELSVMLPGNTFKIKD